MAKKPRRSPKDKTTGRGAKPASAARSASAARAGRARGGKASATRPRTKPSSVAVGAAADPARAAARAAVASVNERISSDAAIPAEQLDLLVRALSAFNAGTLRAVRPGAPAAPGAPSAAAATTATGKDLRKDARAGRVSRGAATSTSAMATAAPASDVGLLLAIEDHDSARPLRQFFEAVGAGAIAAQRRLDSESQAYLAEAAATGLVPPTMFRIPKVEAELSFAAESTTSSGFNIFVASRQNKDSESYRNSVKFEIVAAPPPMPVAKDHSSHFPALAQLVLSPDERATLLARLRSAAEARGYDISSLVRRDARAERRLLMLRQRELVSFRSAPGLDGDWWDRGLPSILFVRVAASPRGQPGVDLATNRAFESVGVSAARLTESSDASRPDDLEVELAAVELTGAARLFGMALIDLVDWQERFLAMVDGGTADDARP
ncbi:MAG: hypothetical protein U0575_11515 [Phycisphaerales bacterium]